MACGPASQLTASFATTASAPGPCGSDKSAGPIAQEAPGAVRTERSVHWPWYQMADHPRPLESSNEQRGIGPPASASATPLARNPRAEWDRWRRTRCVQKTNRTSVAVDRSENPIDKTVPATPGPFFDGRAGSRRAPDRSRSLGNQLWPRRGHHGPPRSPAHRPSLEAIWGVLPGNRSNQATVPLCPMAYRRTNNVLPNQLAHSSKSAQNTGCERKTPSCHASARPQKED